LPRSVAAGLGADREADGMIPGGHFGEIGTLAEQVFIAAAPSVRDALNNRRT
jgi:hypothetical protein